MRLHTPQRAVTPGQAAVCYAGDEVLGGGWIVRPKAAALAPKRSWRSVNGRGARGSQHFREHRRRRAPCAARSWRNGSPPARICCPARPFTIGREGRGGRRDAGHSEDDPAEFARLEARLRALHSYELPEIVALPVEAGSPAIWPGCKSIARLLRFPRPAESRRESLVQLKVVELFSSERVQQIGARGARHKIAARAGSGGSVVRDQLPQIADERRVFVVVPELPGEAA